MEESSVRARAAAMTPWAYGFAPAPSNACKRRTKSYNGRSSTTCCDLDEVAGRAHTQTHTTSRTTRTIQSMHTAHCTLHKQDTSQTNHTPHAHNTTTITTTTTTHTPRAKQK
jgi:hypothetical protein